MKARILSAKNNRKICPEIFHQDPSCVQISVVFDPVTLTQASGVTAALQSSTDSHWAGIGPVGSRSRSTQWDFQ
ncbi:hypothetical protein RRG08_000494 [Elysia crispata]|uniref:Uncharacterized protein n=1 Tax=Elysia crispata TaxID=231223 RepID=A0AAE0YC27_9GAST|nr:hypothetical protein RRG08_000494 [Elysia crispata]